MGRRKNIHPANARSLRAAAARLRRGELVAFPTETVYGLGANALDEKAVAKIFAKKGRPHDNPVIVHVSDLKMLRRVCEGRAAARRPLVAPLLAGASDPHTFQEIFNPLLGHRRPRYSRGAHAAGPRARPRAPRGRPDRRAERERLGTPEPDDGRARRRGLPGRLRPRRRPDGARPGVDRRCARAISGDPETGRAERGDSPKDDSRARRGGEAREGGGRRRAPRAARRRPLLQRPPSAPARSTPTTHRRDP